MTATVFYPSGSRHGEVAYRAPQRLRLIASSGPAQGESIWVQVRRTSCRWWTGPKFRHVVCGSAIWDDGFVAQQLTANLLAGLLPRASFVRATTVADGAAGTVRIGISAPESPPLCAPWLDGPCGFDPRGRYHGTLLVAVSSGLPLSFSSTITLRGRTFTFQRVRFSYHHLVPITLPAGRHVPCPASTARNQWCLERR